MTSSIDNEDPLWIERYHAYLYLNYRGFEVDDNYSFNLKSKKGMKSAYIRHFGLIDVEGKIYTFIDFLDAHLKQKRSTILNDVYKRLGLKKSKIETLPHLNGYQSSIEDFEDEEVYKKRRCGYQLFKLLSATPLNTSPESFPYQIVNNGVILHEVYAPLFPKGKIAIMTKDRADMLLCTHIGFDKERGCPVKINRSVDNTVTIDIYFPTGDIATVDCI